MQAASILELSKSESGRCQMRSNGSLDFLCTALFSEYSDISLTVARALRNSCAGNIENATYLTEMKVVQWLATCCREIALLKSDFDDDSDSNGGPYGGTNGESFSKRCNTERESFVLALCHLLSNFAACGVQSSLFLWSTFFGEDGFRDALAAAATVKSRAGIAAVISTIYNSIKQIGGVKGGVNGNINGTNGPNHGINRGSVENFGLLRLCSSRGLSAQLLLSAAPTTNNIGNSVPIVPIAAAATDGGGGTAPSSSFSSSSISPVSNTPDSSNDPVLEWLHILFFHLIKNEKDSLLKMFTTLQPRALGESVWDFDVTKDNGSDEKMNPFIEETIEIGEIAILTHEQIILLQIVLTIFEDSALTEELIQSEYSSNNSNINVASSNINNNDINSNDINKITSATKIINEDKENEGDNISAIKNNLLHTICDLINKLYTRTYKKNSDNSDNSDENGSNKKKNNAFNNYIQNNDSSDLLLLCLNTLGAGVSYPPRDRGSLLRASIGGTKVLKVCCNILERSQVRKSVFLSRKAKEREVKIAMLAEMDLNAEKEGSNSNISSNSNSNSSNSSNNSNSNISSEHPDKLTEEEEREGEVVKTALQVMGNLAYGCAYVQVK